MELVFQGRLGTEATPKLTTFKVICDLSAKTLWVGSFRRLTPDGPTGTAASFVEGHLEVDVSSFKTTDDIRQAVASRLQPYWVLSPNGLKGDVAFLVLSEVGQNFELPGMPKPRAVPTGQPRNNGHLVQPTSPSDTSVGPRGHLPPPPPTGGGRRLGTADTAASAVEEALGLTSAAEPPAGGGEAVEPPPADPDDGAAAMAARFAHTGDGQGGGDSTNGGRA